jgi:hypothetical protein
MTREEFEAVLAVEGKFIKVIPTTPAGRFHPSYRNKANTWWDAVVWEWDEIYPYQIQIRSMLYGGLPDVDTPKEKVKRTIGTARNYKTNHAAVKRLMKAWEKGLF